MNALPAAAFRLRIILMTATLCCLMGSAAIAEDAMTGRMIPFESVQFAPDQDVSCLASALETGNPTKGSSTSILKAPPGCVVPWHSHTAEEQLIVVTGSVITEMKGQPPTRLSGGGFAVMASHVAHKFSCQGPDMCVMFATFDRAYDIKWEKGP